MRALLAVTSLLISTALLLIGHGMQLTLLPLRGSLNGLSEFVIGMSASSYFLGFVAGALVIPRIIAKVGHIRSFAVLTAILTSALLGLEVLAAWPAWLLLRFLTGATICGLYTVIESWLNDQASPDSRGQVLAIYTFIILTSMAAGQLLINVGPASSSTPFILAAIFLALAIVPVGLTSRLAPAPLESTRTRFSLLYRRSPPAFAGALVSGLVVGGFWSLGAVFAQRYSQSLSDVTLFITAAIAGGALFQYPIGWLSDRVDRRLVMLSLCLLGMLTSAAVAYSIGLAWHLGAVFLFGACVMPMYAISLAMAADNSSSSEFVEIGTSVLMLNAISAAVAPLFLGQLMTAFNPAALFWASALICALFAVYVGFQCLRTRRLTVEEQTPFSAAAMETAPTAFDLDPRGPEDAVGDLVPEDVAPTVEPAANDGAAPADDATNSGTGEQRVQSAGE
jgi:MFS family permease